MSVGLVKLKKKRSLYLKHGHMYVCEYHDQLLRYAPYEVNTDEKKHDMFMEGLNDGIQMMLIAYSFNNF